MSDKTSALSELESKQQRLPTSFMFSKYFHLMKTASPSASSLNFGITLVAMFKQVVQEKWQIFVQLWRLMNYMEIVAGKYFLPWQTTKLYRQRTTGGILTSYYLLASSQAYQPCFNRTEHHYRQVLNSMHLPTSSLDKQKIFLFASPPVQSLLRYTLVPQICPLLYSFY